MIRLVSDNTADLTEILERLRRSLKVLGSRRIQRGRLRYWDLKPNYCVGETFEV